MLVRPFPNLQEITARIVHQRFYDGLLANVAALPNLNQVPFPHYGKAYGDYADCIFSDADALVKLLVSNFWMYACNLAYFTLQNNSSGKFFSI